MKSGFCLNNSPKKELPDLGSDMINTFVENKQTFIHNYEIICITKLPSCYGCNCVQWELSY